MARSERRHRRRTVRVKVRYAVGGAERSELATTLGAGGLFIRTDEPLEAGTPLELRFQLPGGAAHAIRAEVVWAHDPAAAASPGMGVAFVDRAASDRLARELDALD